MTAPLPITMPRDTPAFKEFLDFADRVLVHRPTMSRPEILEAARLAKAYSDKAQGIAPGGERNPERTSAVRHLVAWLRELHRTRPGFRVSLTPSPAGCHSCQMTVYYGWRREGERWKALRCSCDTMDHEEAQVRIRAAVAQAGIPLEQGPGKGHTEKKPPNVKALRERTITLALKFAGESKAVRVRRTPHYRDGEADKPRIGLVTVEKPIQYFSLGQGVGEADCLATIEAVAVALRAAGKEVSWTR